MREGTRPVILVHGFLGTRGTMQPLTRKLQGDGRVVYSYHHGTFQLQSLRKSARALRDHAKKIVEELGVDRVDVVGFSMGGLVALHTLKFLDGARWIRRVVTLGAPFGGTWASALGVATLGLVSPSVWQVLPRSKFLHDLQTAPLPPGVRIRQIHAEFDAICPNPGPITGIDRDRDFILIKGGHSSLVVANHVYPRIREFLDAEDPDPRTLAAPEEDPAQTA